MWIVTHTYVTHTYIRDTMRVSSQPRNQNRKLLKGCLTLHAEAQKSEATPGHSDTHTRLYTTEPELNQKCSEEETG